MKPTLVDPEGLPTRQAQLAAILKECRDLLEGDAPIPLEGAMEVLCRYIMTNGSCGKDADRLARALRRHLIDRRAPP